MKVKIGDKIYDPDDVPIMVILTPEDKDRISRMDPSATCYGEFPDSMCVLEIEKWMAQPGGVYNERTVTDGRRRSDRNA